MRRERSPPPRFIPELDGLRAFAILLVLITHLWSYPAGHELLNRVARFGWSGVDLFFVLSGYLITGILWDTRSGGRYYRNFYARRVLRIFPLYYLLMLVVFVALPFHGVTPELLAARSHWVLYTAYLANVALASHGWQLFLLDITWSLSVEEQFYLIWPWLVRRVTTAGMLTLCGVLIVATPFARFAALRWLHVHWMWTYMMPFFRADAFAVGALIAILRRENIASSIWLRRAALGTAAILGPMAAALVLTGRFARESLLVNTVGYSLLALVGGALVVIAVQPGRVAHGVLSLRPLRHIGKVSYGMYIFHPLCLVLGGTALARAASLSGRSLSGVPGALAQLAAISLLTIAVATVSFTLFERPILRLKRFFEPAGEGTLPAGARWTLRGAARAMWTGMLGE